MAKFRARMTRDGLCAENRPNVRPRHIARPCGRVALQNAILPHCLDHFACLHLDLPFFAGSTFCARTSAHQTLALNKGPSPQPPHGKRFRENFPARFRVTYSDAARRRAAWDDRGTPSPLPVTATPAAGNGRASWTWTRPGSWRCWPRSRPWPGSPESPPRAGPASTTARPWALRAARPWP